MSCRQPSTVAGDARNQTQEASSKQDDCQHNNGGEAVASNMYLVKDDRDRPAW